MHKSYGKIIKKVIFTLRRGLLIPQIKRAGFNGGALRTSIVNGIRKKSLATALSLAGAIAVLALVITAVFSKPPAKAEEPGALILNENEQDIVRIAATPTPVARQNANVAPTPEPTPTPVAMGKGMSGDDVKLVQQRLMELGYMDFDEPTGNYGSMTKQAVEIFQRRHSLDMDGYVGEATYDRLMREDALPYMVANGDEGVDVEELQKRLVELDYMNRATGFFGDETEAAVKDFQDRNHLSRDGMIGNITREALYGEDAIPRSLSIGEKSEEVLKYQKRLFKLGYLTTEPDGTFGKDTQSAVKLFQELNGLIADGHIGPETKRIMMGGDAQANALVIGSQGDTVKSMQRLLKKYGYLSGADGYFGSGTEAAVRNFQKNNGLTADGKVGRATMTKLVSGNVKSATKEQANEAENAVGSAPSSSGGTSSGGNYSSGASADRLIEIALSKLNSRYKRGAKGPSSFDCSGFVYWCLNQAGVRQSYMTSKTWRSVTKYRKISSIEDVGKGDILVFRFSSSSGHVGIAINGSEMVDASSGTADGRVVRRSYKTDYWRKYFYCAYKIF